MTVVVHTDETGRSSVGDTLTHSGGVRVGGVADVQKLVILNIYYSSSENGRSTVIPDRGLKTTSTADGTAGILTVRSEGSCLDWCLALRTVTRVRYPQPIIPYVLHEAHRRIRYMLEVHNIIILENENSKENPQSQGVSDSK